MSPDIINTSIQKFGCWEPDQTEIFIELLLAHDSSSTIFIDVGAHIGYYSIIAATSGYNCISIESNPQTFQRLLESVSLNGLGAKVFAINAFCSEDGKSPRTIELGQLGIASKVIIKTDVEGFEPKVLKPILSWFSRHSVTALIAEASSKYASTWPDFVSLANQILHYGYCCYDIGNSPDRALTNDHDWFSFSSLDTRKVDRLYEEVSWSPHLVEVGQTNLLFLSKRCQLIR